MGATPKNSKLQESPKEIDIVWLVSVFGIFFPSLSLFFLQEQLGELLVPQG